MAEITQPATVLAVTDLTPHVRQLVVKPKTSKISFQAGTVGLSQTAGGTKAAAQPRIFLWPILRRRTGS